MTGFEVDDLDVLQILRIKGAAADVAVADALRVAGDVVAERLAVLEAQGSVWRVATPPGAWALTREGIDVHAEQAELRRASGTTDVRVGYEVFLEVNQDVKQLTSDWQRGAEPLEVLDELGEIHEQVGEGFAIAARDVPRFGAYAERLGTALEQARAGDRRFVADPLLPSFHTVWFECHEDFLITLGRSRAQEGST
ncbi:hypothetical protein DSM104299_00473 [Baekduia alba]|uniref:hypothetical protein n=1 Tax=Baekduia alba TaxID=2997333 RepID=UPI00233F926D|nr:hypothetical protein [Baekduia alba]WCB91796.1 hypothetical protein DSM104299_00473 [Baekduia alba]